MCKMICLMAVLSSLVALGGTNEELTICQLANTKASYEKVVSVRARMGFTMHGMFLVGDDACKGNTDDIVLLFPNLDGPPVDFELDTHAREKLSPFFSPTGGVAMACGVVEGRLFKKQGFRAVQRGAGPQGNGFGPRGSFSLAFVLRSVTEIRAC
jgi:hypothetical protein